jgi:LytS/YehU family sensor histidine kinase
MSYLLATWGAAAVVVSVVLVGSAWVAAYLIERPAPQLALLFGMGVLLYLLSAGLHYTALAVEASHAAERSAAEARTLAREAELQALRAQINPHFLFNSLHSIAALATIDGARAREMCVRLSGFLRGSLGLAGRESIPLREELALA